MSGFMALSRTVLAVIVIVILAIAGIGAYTLSVANSTVTVSTTVTQVSTVTQGTGGQTVTVTQGGQTVTQTVTQTASGSGGGINQTLIALSKAEGGQVTCYCVMDTGDWPTFNAILTKEFPWIHMNYVGLSPGDIVTRAKTEYQAGHVQADILVDSQPALMQLIPTGALASYNSQEEIFNNYSGVDTSGYIHPIFGLPIVLEWNTHLITDNSTLPTSWYGIADSQWKGKLAIDDPSTLNLAGPLFASLGGSPTNQSFVNWLNQVKANNPIITSSAGDVYTDISTGQAAIGLGYLNDVLGGQSSGAPVGFKTLGNSFYISPVPGALTTNAPHPYTARLLLEWFQSYSGAVAFSLTGRTPVFGLVASHYFPSIPQGTALVPMGANTTPNMYTNGTAWVNLYTSIFGP